MANDRSARPNRREVLGWSLAAGAGLALPSAVRAAAPTTSPATSPTAFRVVHLTDAHVQPELGAADGLVACLRHIREHAKPDLIIAGGDQVFDAFNQERDRAQLLFDLWARIVKEECPTPIAYTLGNHDIWGWDKTKSKTSGTEPGWGKAWATQVYAMPGRYYSLDRGGWHFAILDSIHPDPTGAYVARLDDEQFAWLEADLSKVDAGTPIAVVSHVPILSATPLLSSKSDTVPNADESIGWSIVRGNLHVDARRLKDLFKRYPNVKLALSGHIHMVDRVDYLGVAYLNDTAVSGNWWKGDRQEFKNGYTVLDLHADGTFTHETVNYGWVARN